MTMKSLSLLVVCWILLQISAWESEDHIMLNSTLNNVRIAYSSQRITFSCVVRCSQILYWSSEEYIGIGGTQLALFSSGVHDTDSSGNTTARRITTYIDNGVPVIVSELCLTTSLQHPTATVTCTNNGHGDTENITFQTIALPQEKVILTSTLSEGNITYPGQSIIFTCVTTDSQILQWSSNEYIGMGNAQLELFSSGQHVYQPSIIDPHTFARRLDDTSDNEPYVIVSEMHLIASPQHPTATVTCTNNGHSEAKSITFQVTNNLEASSEHTTSSANVVESGLDTKRGVQMSTGSVPSYYYVIIVTFAPVLCFIVVTALIIFKKLHKTDTPRTDCDNCGSQEENVPDLNSLKENRTSISPEPDAEIYSGLLVTKSKGKNANGGAETAEAGSKEMTDTLTLASKSDVDETDHSISESGTLVSLVNLILKLANATESRRQQKNAEKGVHEKTHSQEEKTVNDAKKGETTNLSETEESDQYVSKSEEETSEDEATSAL